MLSIVLADRLHVETKKHAYENAAGCCRIDEKADAIYMRLDESKIVESQEVQPGIVLDFNEHNQVVGIEILRVKDRVPQANLKQMQFEVA